MFSSFLGKTRHVPCSSIFYCSVWLEMSSGNASMSSSFYNKGTVLQAWSQPRCWRAGVDVTHLLIGCCCSTPKWPALGNPGQGLQSFSISQEDPWLGRPAKNRTYLSVLIADFLNLSILSWPVLERSRQTPVWVTLSCRPPAATSDREGAYCSPSNPSATSQLCHCSRPPLSPSLEGTCLTLGSHIHQVLQNYLWNDLNSVDIYQESSVPLIPLRGTKQNNTGAHILWANLFQRFCFVYILNETLKSWPEQRRSRSRDFRLRNYAAPLAPDTPANASMFMCEFWWKHSNRLSISCSYMH